MQGEETKQAAPATDSAATAKDVGGFLFAPRSKPDLEASKKSNVADSSGKAMPESSMLSTEKPDPSIMPSVMSETISMTNPESAALDKPVTAVIADYGNLSRIKNVSFNDLFDDQERYPLEDLGLGNFYADTFKSWLRYVGDAGKWYYFTNGRWQEDMGSVYASQCAKALIEHLKKILSDDIPEQKKFKKEVSRRSMRETIVKEAKDVYPISLSDFDADPYLLNCSNGTLDLRTCKFRDHDPADFLSKKINAAYDPDAKCNRWDEFISQIACEDESLAFYLQKCLGYGLSGDISEECLFIAYGPTTRNGKGTTMETIYHLLGDYAKTIQPGTLAERRSNGSAPSADIARLAGIRFVNASELPNDMKLNAAMVKQITGGDTVTTRFLHQNFFEYRPQYKLFINTNHLPEVADDSLFASQRIKLIPFNKHFSEKEQDPGLKNYFREEGNKSAILNWLIDGFKRYKADADRLVPPPIAEKCLRDYRLKSDAVGLYIKNRLEPCDTDIEKSRTKTSVFYRDFLEWCKDEDVAEMSLKEFVQAIRQKNCLDRDRKIGHYIRGYKIK